MDATALVDVVIALALIEYFAFGLLVGRARGRFNVPAPAIAGHPTFERTFRAHQNTLEQLIVFVPAIWIFASTVSAEIAAGLGLLFVVGRALYFRGYVAEAAKRSAGFAIGALAQLALLLGALIGAALKALG
ncbi:MAG TPA: MAPEG family protein [Myxococcota bacterium]|nr:MAPEG family protein [Myxococcota bacterium]